MSSFISPLHDTVYNNKNGMWDDDGGVSDYQDKSLFKFRVFSPQSNRQSERAYLCHIHRK